MFVERHGRGPQVYFALHGWGGDRRTFAPLAPFVPEDAMMFALYSGMSVLNWKFLLAGFVLFRFFDILKPFPCRRLEHLSGGWGIMADDWIAGLYAALVLALARHLGL